MVALNPCSVAAARFRGLHRPPSASSFHCGCNRAFCLTNSPAVIRAARSDAKGRADLDRIEYALGTIGKALILTDYTIDEEKDMDKLQAFRESQQR